MGRNKRISFKGLLCLCLGTIGLTAALLVLISMYPGKSQGAELGDDGFITKGTHTCGADRIIPKTVDDLEHWRSLIERLEAVDGDNTKLSEADNDLGRVLVRYCGTLAEGYPVILFKVDGDYALVLWDKSLGFDAHPFIIRLSDFQSGGFRL